jgi:pimeloyl-[acyl-carrier protein] methyl ester esterase
MPSLTPHRESQGEGPPVVLWHGWGANLRVFDALVKRLATHHQVIAVDLPGHGRSPWPAGASGFESLRDALHATLPRDCILIGWSLGATLAMQAALALSGRLRALVLLHATPRFLADTDWTAGMSAALLAQFAGSLRADCARTVSDFLDLQVRGTRDAPAVLAALRTALQAQGDACPEALAAGLELLAHADLRSVAARLDLPALVCGGQYDRVTPPAAGRALAALLPQADYHEFARAGHASFLSHTDELAATLLAWLARLEPVAA